MGFSYLPFVNQTLIHWVFCTYLQYITYVYYTHAQIGTSVNVRKPTYLHKANKKLCTVFFLWFYCDPANSLLSYLYEIKYVFIRFCLTDQCGKCRSGTRRLNLNKYCRRDYGTYYFNRIFRMNNAGACYTRKLCNRDRHELNIKRQSGYSWKILNTYERFFWKVYKTKIEGL